MEQSDIGMGLLNKKGDFGIRSFFEHESDRGLPEMQCPNIYHPAAGLCGPEG